MADCGAKQLMGQYVSVHPCKREEGHKGLHENRKGSRWDKKATAPAAQALPVEGEVKA